MNKTTKLAIAVGSALAASAALSPAARAADNPFGLTALSAGYQLAQADTKMKDGKCGEAKCGADKKAKEAKCGADKMKDGKCGGDKAKMKDGKCGEAKCGADKKAKEAKCGADKMKDGKCGGDKK